MLHPAALHRRAAKIERQAEAVGDRAAVGLAQVAGIQVTNARWALAFLSDRPRPVTVQSLTWRYEACASEVGRCKRLLRAAAANIARAETALLAAEIARAEIQFVKAA